MAQAAIEIDSVTKVFKIYREKVQSTKERVIRLGRNPYERFRALDDVSITVAEGETMALLGHNGSGKSTLLKCVSGTLRPTSGRITIPADRRLAALLELGAGFHGDLTGRENVYLNGSILGFSKSQVDRIFDDIVEFSELEDFIDNQVKHFSSGMYARLGFAVAINVEPDILVVDEVLSVGDEAFQRKCIDRIKQFQRSGRTILVVSHAAELVRQIADRAAVLDHGHVVDIAPPGEAIRTFRETLAKSGIQLPDDSLLEPPPSPVAPSQPIDLGPAWSGPPSGSVPAIKVDKAVQITDVRVEYPEPKARYLMPDQPMRVRIDYVAPERIDNIAFALEAHDEDSNLVIATDTETSGMPIHAVEGVGALCFDMDRVPLLDGTYLLTVVAQTRDGGTTWDRRDQEDRFEVMNPTRERGMVHVPLKVVHYFQGAVPT
ncbi:MAG: ABC transporter ATP-binding protein [Actinomycetota bacterium]|nr:ABC transporter ATP-binding protein [Actinomycetota bacterium]